MEKLALKSRDWNTGRKKKKKKKKELVFQAYLFWSQIMLWLYDDLNWTPNLSQDSNPKSIHVFYLIWYFLGKWKSLPMDFIYQFQTFIFLFILLLLFLIFRKGMNFIFLFFVSFSTLFYQNFEFLKPSSKDKRTIFKAASRSLANIEIISKLWFLKGL